MRWARKASKLDGCCEGDDETFLKTSIITRDTAYGTRYNNYERESSERLYCTNRKILTQMIVL